MNSGNELHLNKPVVRLQSVIAFLFLSGFLTLFIKIMNQPNSFILFQAGSLLIMLIGLVFSVYLMLQMRKDRLQSVWSSVNKRFGYQLFSILLVLIFFVTLVSFLFSIVFALPQSEFLEKWKLIYSSVFPFFPVLTAIGLLSLILIIQLIGSLQRLFEKINLKTSFTTLMVLLIFFGSVMHWALLYYQVRLFKVIPGWFWKFHTAEYNDHNWFLIPLIIVSIGIIWLAWHWRKNPILAVGLTMVWGMFLQFGFGFFDGSAYEGVRSIFADSSYSIYAEHAADRPDLLDAVRNYEEKYAEGNYLGTKPPGVIVIYSGIQKAATLFKTEGDFVERRDDVLNVITFLFPVLSMISVILIYILSKELIGDEGAIIPGLIFVLCTNILIIPLFLDQAIFPVLFLGGLLLTQYTIRKNSILFAFLSGLYFYSAAFFSFSMLPLLLLSALWVGFSVFRKFDKQSLTNFLRIIGGVIAGIGVGFLLAYLFLNYDFITRYQHAFATHASLKLLETDIGSKLNYFLLNNVEFSAWIGFAVVVPAVFQVIRSFRGYLAGEKGPTVLFSFSFILTYGALQVFSQTRGEVGRIWMFLVPVICILAVDELLFRFKKPMIIITGIAGLQLITTFLTDRFQGFFG